MSKTKRMAVEAVDGPVISDRVISYRTFQFQAYRSDIQVFMPLIVSYLPFAS